jgi:hypothetical protein
LNGAPVFISIPRHLKKLHGFCAKRRFKFLRKLYRRRTSYRLQKHLHCGSIRAAAL